VLPSVGTLTQTPCSSTWVHTVPVEAATWDASTALTFPNRWAQPVRDTATGSRRGDQDDQHTAA